MSDLSVRAAGAAWWSALEILARYGMQFVVMVILARLLTPEDFGLVAMLLVFISIGTLFVDAGFGAALVQRQNITVNDETTIFIFTTCASLIVAGILALSAPWIAAFFDQPKLIDLTRFMALALPLGALASVPDAILTIKLDFKSRARAEVIASILSGIIAITLALHGAGVWSLAWQGLISIGIRGLLLWSYTSWRPRGVYSHASFQSLFRFGGYMLLSNLLNTIAVRLQSLAIGKLFDARQLGFYTLAQNTQSAPATFMGSLLTRVGLPVFSTIADDRERLLGALRSSLRMAMFLFVPCMVGIAIVARPLIELLYGEKWSSAAPILSLLSLSSTLWPIHVLNLAAISAQGRSDLFLRLEVIKQCIGIALIIAFAAWGPLAIASAVLTSGLFAAMLNTYYSKKMLGYGLMAQLRDQWPTFALSLVVAGIGWAILHWTKASIFTMLVAVITCAFTYLLLAVLTKNEALRELKHTLQTLRPKSSTISS
ncbi:lipopolysaccharide biosynthesis protein [Stenotrophobium rhamnosiphilum]|uniref:Uncharacterized protein n=1 Tax=Stenotrophobium rhamnosiphilum TaxID=2029166 RepID=A0A2T5MDL1_9GAMM|nr:lipopolysaccharide biosynthesis protein [Stenotrophobium rhamnosiphilum]PTU30670.1 hypothetical protein CJD38_14335 [Stenotrophobium rhamnosiphilum]